MSKRLRSCMAVVMAMFFALAIMVVPQKAWADETIWTYADETSGCSVSVIENGGAVGSRDVRMTVLLDGTVVKNETIESIKNSVYHLDVKCQDEYNVFVTEDGNSLPGLGGYYSIAPSTDSIVVSFARESKGSTTKIQDSDTTYGTFSWSNSVAVNAAYPRMLTVRVNGENKHAQMVATAPNLSNAGQNNQFWFTPNQELYSIGSVTLDPETMLNESGNRNITVDLLTRCKCGNDLCQCPGGCECEPGCTNPECNPQLTDTMINTRYGIIGYEKPGQLGGYNLKVQVYVNGQQKFESDRLRVHTGAVGDLTFTPKAGYYFHEPNGYDIESDGASTWRIGSGYLLIVGDRDDDNILKIYLWTFNNYTNLDVERRGTGNAEELGGYIISYDAYNPETRQNETYTYPATSFLLAQSQVIPTGTDVTITGQCPPGKEVTEWSHGYYDGGVSLTSTSDEDISDTKAPGNTVTLRVDNTALTSITIYAEGVELADLPTSEEVAELVGENGVKVDCINGEANHEDKDYPLDASTLNVNASEGGNTKVKVDLTPDAYVEKYNTDVEAGHTLIDGTKS